MKEYFGNIPLRQFDTLKVEQYQTYLLNQGLKPASINKNISILKAMIRKAIDWNLVVEDVLRKVVRVKQLQENNRDCVTYQKKNVRNLSVTVRYAHLAPSHKVKAVDVLDNYINEKFTAQKLHNLKRRRNV